VKYIYSYFELTLYYFLNVPYYGPKSFDILMSAKHITHES